MNEPVTAVTDPNENQPFRVVPAGLVLTAITVGLGILATVVALSAGWHALLAALWGSAAWCLASAWVALWPVALRSAKAPDGAAMGFVIGILIRMPLCLIGVFVLSQSPRLTLMASGLAMAGWYMTLLVAEVCLVKQYLMQHGGRPQPPQSSEKSR